MRSQLYVFYELTRAMRTTLRLDEITYIILTGLTAGQGLGFNRAVLFLVDEETNKIQGFMGIGPMDAREAETIWRSIEEEQKDLYALIENYRHIQQNKLKPKFLEFVRSLSFPLNKESGLIFDILAKQHALWLKQESLKSLGNDPLVQKFNFEEFLIHPLHIKNKPAGAVVVDNYITKKPLSEEDVKIFNMFMEQARGAIENSQSFESTLLKSHTDSLTSLWNHGYFQYKLDEEISKAKSSRRPLAIMMIDVDDFKKFNDTHGHTQGDETLKQISRILAQNCRKIDVLCRYGGEEFSLILPDSSRRDALLLGERIRKSIAQETISGNNFTVSIGIAAFSADTSDKTTLIKQADTALYAAKRQGKNRVILA